MSFLTTFMGIAASALVLVLLVLAKWLNPIEELPVVEIREIELSSLSEPPPPPPPLESEPPPTEDFLPPPPALTDVSEIADPSQVPIPKAQFPMDVSMPVDSFFTDIAPVALPTQPVSTGSRSQPINKGVPKGKVGGTGKPTPGPTKLKAPPAAVKSSYDVNELDGRPRLIRHGSTTFPSELTRKGITRGTVVLEVELSTNGRVTVRRVVSSQYPELVSAARRVASSSRFTPPKKNGQAVKAIMRWPITIQK